MRETRKEANLESSTTAEEPDTAVDYAAEEPGIDVAAADDGSAAEAGQNRSKEESHEKSREK